MTNIQAQVISSAAGGLSAAVAINSDLITDDTERAVQNFRVRRGVQDPWDQRYATVAQVWSGQPNTSLVSETRGLRPGRALDVGCGEGADALWLAEHGWDVTALDVSRVALDRAADEGERVGVQVRWLHAGLVEAALPPASFDLVSAQYPALLRTEDHESELALLNAVAPGGVLLVVHHPAPSKEQANAHGFNPDDYVSPADVTALLDDPATICNANVGMLYRRQMAWDTEGTRRRLKEAATAEFAEQGLDGTTMTRIAGRAGINKERLYSYYGDKNALWEVVLSDELDRLATAVELAGAGLDDIGNFAGATYDYHAAHPQLGRLLQWEGLTRGPPADARRRSAHYREKVERFAQAQRDGVLDAGLDPAYLVFALIALAAWWQTVPQLAEMITGASGDDITERDRRRAFVVDAARRLAAAR